MDNSLVSFSSSDLKTKWRDELLPPPSANISKAEALALLWKSAGMTTDTSDTRDGTFYDTAGTPANTWQENLLQSARLAGIIAPTETGTGEAKKLLQSGAIYVNEVKIEDTQKTFTADDFVNGILLLRK